MNALKGFLLLAVLWLPRVFCILLALLTLPFTFDAFDGSDPVWKKLLGWLIHLIPTLVLALIAWLSWKRPLIGAAGLIILAALYYFTFAQRMNNHVIDITLFSVGILFLFSWLLGRRISSVQEEIS